MVFVPAAAPPASSSGPCYWFVTVREGLLVRPAGERFELPRLDEPAVFGLARADATYLGHLDGVDCFAARAPGAAPDGWVVKGLRGLFTSLGEPLWLVAGRALQLLHFEQTHRFCGRCGLPTSAVPRERSVRCAPCELSMYPRLSPAIIVLVRRGREALLARGARFPAAFYSTLAGFVEPGESLEQTVQREVREESGVEVTNVRYFGSQPWPFPHSLMVGFTAEHAGGEPTPDGVEILEARWFAPDALPAIPPRPSIARALIDAWVAGAG